MRLTAHETPGRSYRLLRLTASLAAGALTQALCSAVGPGEQLLHLDLAAGQPLLASDAFAAQLTELLMVGRLGKTAALRKEESGETYAYMHIYIIYI